MGRAPRRHADDAVGRPRAAPLAQRPDRSEVEQIYLPISRLLAFYVRAPQLFRATQRFLGPCDARSLIIGVAGSVAVGKSTTARVLRELL